MQRHTGWTAILVVALAFAVGAGSLAWLGRFAAAEQWLARAHRALRSEESPGTELALHHASGLLRLGQGRLEEALAAFRRAESMQEMLEGEHALTVDLRMRIVLTLVGMGNAATAREELDVLPSRSASGPRDGSVLRRWRSQRAKPSGPLRCWLR